MQKWWTYESPAEKRERDAKRFESEGQGLLQKLMARRQQESQDFEIEGQELMQRLFGERQRGTADFEEDVRSSPIFRQLETAQRRPEPVEEETEERGLLGRAFDVSLQGGSGRDVLREAFGKIPFRRIGKSLLRDVVGVERPEELIPGPIREAGAEVERMAKPVRESLAEAGLTGAEAIFLEPEAWSRLGQVARLITQGKPREAGLLLEEEFGERDPAIQAVAGFMLEAMVPGWGFTKVPALGRAGARGALAAEERLALTGLPGTRPLARDVLRRRGVAGVAGAAEEAAPTPPTGGRPPMELGQAPEGAPLPGTRVRAADRGNIGTISHYSEDGQTAYVFFHNRKTGLQETVGLRLDRLTAVGKAARTGGRPPGGAAGAGERLPPPPLEPPGGAPPRRSRRAAAGGGSDGIMSAITNAPSDEPTWRTLWRRWQGERQLEGDDLLLESRSIQSEARSAGISLTSRPTEQMQRLMAALHYDAPLESLPANEAAWAGRVREMLKTEEARTLAVDPSFQTALRPEYFPQYFKSVKREAVGVGGPRRLGTRFGFQRQRKLEGTLAEILEGRPDLDLASWNPLDLAFRRITDGINHRANHVQLERLRAMGLVKKQSQAPTGWITPNAPAFRSRPIKVDLAAGERVFSEPLAVPKEIAEALEDQFGRSAFSLNQPLGVVRNVVAVAKTIKVLGGLFQHFDFSQRTLGLGVGQFRPQMIPAVARAWGRAFIPGVEGRFLKYDLQNPTRRSILQNGLQVQGGLDILEPELRRALKEPGLVNIPVPIVRNIVNYFTSATYSRAHREFLLSAAEALTYNNMRGGMSLEQAAAAAVPRVNEFFSSKPAWQSILRSPTTRDVARTITFSPNETESWFSSFFRLFKGPNRVQAARYWAGLYLSAAMFAEGLNLLFTGKPLDKEALLPFLIKEDPEGNKQFSFNTRFLRPELPFTTPEGRKAYLDILGQADTPFRWIADPAFAARTRMGQLPQALLQSAPVISGQGPARGFFGEPFEGPKGAAKFAGQLFAPIPVSSLFEEIEVIGPEGAILQATGFNVSAERLASVRDREAKNLYQKSYSELTRAERLEVDASSKVAPAIEGSRQRGLKADQPWAQAQQIRTDAQRVVASLGKQFRSGTIEASEYREQRSHAYTTAAAQRAVIQEQRELKPRTTEERVTQGYYEALEKARQEKARRLGLDPDPRNTQLVRLTADEFEEVDNGYRQQLGVQEAALDAALGAATDNVDREYRQASKLLRDAPPKYNGLSKERGKALDQFRNEVSQIAADTGQPFKSVAYEQAPKRGITQEEFQMAVQLAREAGRRYHLNEAYIRYLVDNQAILEEFYPGLVSMAMERRVGVPAATPSPAPVRSLWEQIGAR